MEIISLFRSSTYPNLYPDLNSYKYPAVPNMHLWHWESSP